MSVSNVAGDRYVGNRSIDVGEIVAFRAWKVVTGGPIPLLRSFSMPYLWRSGVNDCRNYGGPCEWTVSRDLIPTSKNKCGFYALKEYSEILDYWGVSREWYCLGTVELWGEVIVGTKGYRAEYAAIQNIVSLVRAGYKPPRVLKGTAAWKRAVDAAFRYNPYPTVDEEAGKLETDFDNSGPLITRLREVYTSNEK